MLPSQNFNGSPNPSLPRGYVASYWEEQLYVFYGSEYRLVITDWLNQHVQSINLNESEGGKVVCISMCSSDGKLAVASTNKVYILKPDLDFKTKSKYTRWNLDTTIDSNSKVTNLVWLAKDKLVVSGAELNLYQLYTAVPILEWSEPVSSEVFIAEASPDGLWLATVYKDSLTVKIWNLKPDPALGNLRMFSYIQHPKPVHNLEWKNDLTGDGLPLLFTTAKDGIFRCWTNSNRYQPYHFYLCTTIDPGQWSSSCDHLTNSPKCKVWDSPFHWVGSGVVSELARMEARRWESHNKSTPQSEANFGASNSELTALLDLARNPSPLLYQIQHDGALVMWRLEGLAEYPYTQPRALVVAKMFGAVSLTFNSTFNGYAVALPNPRTLQLQEAQYPAELSIFTQGCDGTIEHYTLGISQLLFSNQHGGEFYARTAWPCYHHRIKSIVPAPSPQVRLSSAPPLVVCISDEGTLDVWAVDYKPDIAQAFYKPKLGINFPPKVKLVRWLDFEHILVLSDHACILYRLSSSSDIGSGALLEFKLTNNDDFSSVVNAIVKRTISKTIDSSATVLTYQLLLLCLNPTPNFYLAVFTLDKNNHPGNVSELKESFPLNMSLSDNSYGWIHDTGSLPLGLVNYDQHTRKLHLAQLDSNSVAFNHINQVELPEVPELATIQKLHICSAHNILLEFKSPKGYHLLAYHIGGLAFGFVTFQLFDWNCLDPVVAVSCIKDQSDSCTLAIASPTAHKLFTRPVVATHQPAKWVNYAIIPSKSTLLNFALAWDGSAILQFGSQLTFHGKWLPESTATLVPHPDTVGLIRTCRSLAHNFQSPLPHFHPAIINEFLRWGDFEITDKILDHLNAMVQHQDTFLEDSTLVVPPLPLQTFFPEIDLDSNSGNSPDASSFLFATGLEFRNRNLSEYQIKMLVDVLTKLPLLGLTKLERAWLCRVIRALAKAQRLKMATDGLGFSFLSELFIGFTQLEPTEPDLESNRMEGFSVSSETMVFALHSSSQDLLISECANLFGPVNSLSSFTQLGFPYWIQSDLTLRREVEALARNQYFLDKDPVHCSLLYLALDKKRLLLALWKTSTYHPEHQVMIKFLANDFTLPRWQTAAMKNAFKLIGCQRYNYAAAFFLLAGKLKDAVNVCLRYLQDPSLAFMICRCYQGLDGEETIRVIKEYLLPEAVKSGDRAKVSLLLWHVNLKPLSFQALTCLDFSPVKRELHLGSDADELPLTKPSLHLHRGLKGIKINPNRNSAEVEVRLIVESVTSYQAYGMSLLALYTLDQFQFQPQLPTLSPTLIVDEPDSLGPELKLTEPSPTDLWSWNPPKPTKRMSLLASEGSKPTTPSTPAIDSGLIDFDDWSWGSTPAKKPVQGTTNGTAYFDRAPTSPLLGEITDDTLKLPTHQIVELNGLRQNIAYHLHSTILDALRSTQLPSTIPKPILSEYLDDLKDGIQTLCQHFQLDAHLYDTILVQATLLLDAPALGFDLLFQGILTGQPDPRPTVDTLLTVGALLLTDSLANAEAKLKLGTYVSAGACLEWTLGTLQQFPKWSIALRLEPDNLHHLFQLQLTSLLLLILLLVNSIRTRDYFKLATLLERWDALLQAIQHDLDDLQLHIKKLVDTLVDTNQFPPQLDLDPDQLEFDLSHINLTQDLKLELNGALPQPTPTADPTLWNEVQLFQKVFHFATPPVAQLILNYRPDSKLSTCLVPLAFTILEPLLYLQVSLDQTQSLPFQLQEDLEDLHATPHDSYLEQKFKQRIVQLIG